MGVLKERAVTHDELRNERAAARLEKRVNAIAEAKEVQ